jgi:hypothetical protein
MSRGFWMIVFVLLSPPAFADEFLTSVYVPEGSNPWCPEGNIGPFRLNRYNGENSWWCFVKVNRTYTTPADLSQAQAKAKISEDTLRAKIVLLERGLSEALDVVDELRARLDDLEAKSAVVSKSENE